MTNRISILSVLALAACDPTTLCENGDCSYVPDAPAASLGFDYDPAECTIETSPEGEDMLVCSDGTSLVVPDGTVGTRQLLQPGESMELAHGFADSVVRGQYAVNGRLFDYTRYNEHFDPELGAIWLETPDESIDGEPLGELVHLPNDEVLAAYVLEPSQEERVIVTVVLDSAGNEQHRSEVTITTRRIYQGRATTLSGGGFAVTVEANDGTYLQLYDEDATPGALIPDAFAGAEGGATLAPHTSGGLVAAYRTLGATEDEQEIVLNLFDANGVYEETLFAETTLSTRSTNPSVHLLPNGNYALASMKGDDPEGTAWLTVLDPTGQVLSDQFLSTNLPNSTFGFRLASEGERMTVAYDSNADTIFAGVYNVDGSPVTPLRVVAEEKNDSLGVAMYPDGHVVIATGDGESEHGLIYAMDDEGYMTCDVDVWGGTYAIDSVHDALTMDDEEAWLLADMYMPYDAGVAIFRVARGYLELTEVDGTATLRNRGAEPVTVTLTVTAE